MRRLLIFAMALVLSTALLCSCSPEPTGIGASGISAQEFEMLSLGMEDDDVDSIIGSPGDLVSESKEEFEEQNTIIRIYRYEGEKQGYAELEFTQIVKKGLFEGGAENFKSRLSAKTKYDLQ